MKEWTLPARPATLGAAVASWGMLLWRAIVTRAGSASVLAVLLACWAGLPALAQDRGQSGRRVAFVVGNANYQNESPLQNPHADAALLARTLRQDLGFDEVIEHRDLTRRQMVDLVRTVRIKSAGADAVFVYFSGHGMQGPGGNHLIPVDARINYEEHVASEGIAARDLVDAMRSAAPRVAVLVLDACRDTPYARNTKSATKGLARMDVAGGNLLVAYATTEGTTAADGAPGNSPYAQALARHLKERDRPLLAQFDAVRRTTMRLTGNRQQPTREGDLEVDVHLTGVSYAAPSVNATSMEDASWTLCMNGRTGVPCHEYLRVWPEGRYAALARVRLRDLDASSPQVASAAATSQATSPQARPSAGSTQVAAAAPPPATAATDVKSPLSAGQVLRWKITDDYTGASRLVDLTVTGSGDGRIEFNQGLRREDLAGNRVGSGEVLLAGLDVFQPREQGWTALLSSEGRGSVSFTSEEGRVSLMRRGEVVSGTELVGGLNLRTSKAVFEGQLDVEFPFARQYSIQGVLHHSADLGRVVRLEIRVSPTRQGNSNSRERRETVELLALDAPPVTNAGTSVNQATASDAVSNLGSRRPGDVLRWRLTDNFTGASSHVDLTVTSTQGDRILFDQGARTEGAHGQRLDTGPAQLSVLDIFQPPGDGWHALMQPGGLAGLNYTGSEGKVQLVRRGEVRTRQLKIAGRDFSAQEADFDGVLSPLAMQIRRDNVRGTLTYVPSLARIVRLTIEVRGTNPSTSYPTERRETVELVSIR